MSKARSTEDLIRQLAASPAPEPFRPAIVAGGMLAFLGLALGLFWLAFGLRADLVAAWAGIAVKAKTVLPLLLCLAAIWLALRLSRPEVQPLLWPLAVPVGLGLLLVMVRISQVVPANLLAETAGQTALACLGSISGLALLPLGVGVLLLRRAAPTRPALTGALLGLAAGAGAAAGYALHCTEDSPLFFMAWYGLAIGIAAGAGASLGHRFLRW